MSRELHQPRSISALMADINRLAPFLDALVNYYGATEIPAAPYRCFTNPWAMTSGNKFIWVRTTGVVSYGDRLTRSTRMSDRMITSIGKREQRVPGKAAPIEEPPSPVGREPKQ